MKSTILRAAAPFVLALPLAVAAAPVRAAAAPAAAPPTDAEITRFVALENDLVADAGRAAQFCALQAAGEKESKTDQTPAEIGRKLEANPMFNALLRRHAFSGQRYTEVSLEIFGGALGLGMADDLDQAAREKGQTANNRELLLQRSAEARAVQPRLAEITQALDRVQKLCNSDEDEGDGEPEDDSNP